MEVITKVIHLELYNEKVLDVNTELLKVEPDQGFSCQLELTYLSGQLKSYFGLLTCDEFESEYGFQLVQRTKNIIEIGRPKTL